MKKYVTVLFAAGAMLLASCGDDGETPAADPGPTDQPESDEPTTEPAEDDPATDFAEDLTENLENTQAAQGGGGATFTVGDQTWTFDSVLCAIGEDQTGQEGAEFVLSSIQDGMQMYVAIDSFGHSVSLDDIEDFANPSVSLSSVGDGFVNVDGKNVSAEAEFRDGTTDDFNTTIAGTFTGSCP